MFQATPTDIHGTARKEQKRYSECISQCEINQNTGVHKNQLAPKNITKMMLDLYFTAVNTISQLYA